MKLKRIDSLNYKCDKCGGYRKYIDMYDDNICYNCWDDEEKQRSGFKMNDKEIIGK